MRWPFHFGKAARAEGNAAPETAAPPQRRDWASLAPIQRAIGDVPLTAPSLEFSRSLAGSEEPALSLETLGHHRSPEGPKGLVMGIANPIETYGSATELIGRPRRREAAAGVQTASGELARAAATDAISAGALDADLEPELRARMLPAVAVESPSALTPVSHLTDASRVALGPLRPVQRTPDTAAQPVPAEAGAAGIGDPPPLGTRLNLGLSRRHGLGAPIRAADAAAVQRSAVPHSSPAGLPPPDAQPSSAETPVAAEPQSSPAVPLAPLGLQPATDEDRLHAPLSDPGLASLPPLRGQSRGGRSEERESNAAAEAVETPPEVASAVHDMHGQASPPTQIAPGIGAAPISMQRLVGSDPSRPGARESRNAPEPNTTTPTVPLTSLRPPLSSVRLPGVPALVSVPGSQSSRPLAAFGEMPQPAIQRSPVLSSSPTSAPGGVSAPYAFQAPGPSQLAWNVQRLAPAETPAGGPMGSAPSAGEGGAGPSAEGGAVGAPQPGAATPAGGAGGGPGGGAPAGGAAPHGEKELQELAQALFDPLMSLFRRQVLTERERAGFVTDLR